jgi:hypothetical protein
MKCFRRWIFNISAALSLVVLFAIIAVWIRSEFDYDAFIKIVVDSAAGKHFNYVIIADSGRLVLFRDEAPSNNTWRNRPWTHVPAHSYVGKGPHGDFDNVRWIWLWRGPLGAPPFGVRTELVLRLWMLAVISAVMPAKWAFQRLRGQTKDTSGYCSRCGYDLRATPDRCPECGKVVERAI